MWTLFIFNSFLDQFHSKIIVLWERTEPTLVNDIMQDLVMSSKSSLSSTTVFPKIRWWSSHPGFCPLQNVATCRDTADDFFESYSDLSAWWAILVTDPVVNGKVLNTGLAESNAQPMCWGWLPASTTSNFGSISVQLAFLCLQRPISFGGHLECDLLRKLVSFKFDADTTDKWTDSKNHWPLAFG